jgi:hypothetical protein
MIIGILIWLLTLLMSYFLIGILKQRHKKLEKPFMMALFFYHTLISIAYYFYARTNASDSVNYYAKAVGQFKGDNLFDYYGVSTSFIEFFAFFFVNRLGFNYEACMAFFSWLGFLGFLFFYIFFKERIKSSPKIFGFDGLHLLFLLPNLHFWSASLGKGSLIYFGFGLFFFSLNRPDVRFWALLIGGWLIFQIRPHIFYVILIAIGLGYTFSTKGVAITYRVLILMVAAVMLYFIYDDILKLTGLEDDSIMDPMISHRATELAKATSGIDIANYSIPEKLFAFWFRPLFFDAPGILGYIVSFENLFYLIFFARLLRPAGLQFLVTCDALAKTCLFTFIGVSFALAQISGNLGLAMRQKSQVMILMLFVILKFTDEQNVARIMLVRKRKEIMERLKQKAQSSQHT